MLNGLKIFSIFFGISVHLYIFESFDVNPTSYILDASSASCWFYDWFQILLNLAIFCFEVSDSSELDYQLFPQLFPQLLFYLVLILK